jgi:hypothetical protein
MRAFALGLAIAAATAGDASAARTRPGAWCMVIQDQDDGWACGFASFAQCESEARAGNAGYCIANPNYHAPSKPAGTQKRRQAR